MEVSGQLHAPAALPPVPIGYGAVDPTAGLDIVEKRKILQCGESNPGHPACSPLLYGQIYPDS
jgi:hypothetical protein